MIVEKPVVRRDEIDIGLLISRLWQFKWVTISAVIVSGIFGVAFALSRPNIYESELLLAETGSQTTGGPLASGRLGGLASLAGIDLGIANEKAVIAFRTLNSRQFLMQFIDEHELIVPLLATTGWDEGSGELIIDASLYDQEAFRWVRDVKPPRTREPSLLEAYEVFSEEILSTERIAGEPFVSLSISHFSPILARDIALALVNDLNEVMRRRDILQAESVISYLEAQIEETSVAELRAIFYSMIEAQMQSLMLAESRKSYVYELIDPPVVPEEKKSPNRMLIILVFLFVGFVLGVLIAQFLILLRSHAEKG